MNKFNFKENLDKGISPEEIIKMFFKQICDEGSSTLLDSLIIKEISCLPLPNTDYKIYAVCTQSEINKMISFSNDYVYYEKIYRKINSSCRCQIYNIRYKETWGEIFGTSIECVIIKKCPNAIQMINSIVAEDCEELSKRKKYDRENFVLY